MASQKITFYPSTDPTVVRLLQELGFTAGEISRGEIDQETCDKRGVSFPVLDQIAQSSHHLNCRGATCLETHAEEAFEMVILSEEEASRFYLSPQQENLADLLHTSRCPGRDVANSIVIAKNILNLSHVQRRFYGGGLGIARSLNASTTSEDCASFPREGCPLIVHGTFASHSTKSCK